MNLRHRINRYASLTLATLLLLFSGWVLTAPRPGSAEEAAASKPVRTPALDAELTRRYGTSFFWADDIPYQVQVINKALNSPLPANHGLLSRNGLVLKEAPLSDLVTFVCREYGIDARLDIAALDDLGLSSADTITVDLHNMTLRSALRIVLRQLDLTYIIEEGHLLITSEDEALTRLKVVVYPTGEIILPMEGLGSPNETPPLQSLVALITSTCGEWAWQDPPVESSIETMEPNLVIVTGTQNMHEQITNLIEAIRKAQQHVYPAEQEQEQESELDDLFNFG